MPKGKEAHPVGFMPPVDRVVDMPRGMRMLPGGILWYQKKTLLYLAVVCINGTLFFNRLL